MPVPVATVERLARVLDFAYEGIWNAADRGAIDWSIAGEPLTEALRLIRRIRDDARRAAA